MSLITLLFMKTKILAFLRRYFSLAILILSAVILAGSIFLYRACSDSAILIDNAHRVKIIVR